MNRTIERDPAPASQSAALRPERAPGLLFEDLEIENRPLLEPTDELRLGRAVQRNLRWVDRLVRRHPVAHERLLARLDRAARGRTWVHAWGSDREAFRRDHARARQLLDEARREQAAGRPAGARRSFLQSVGVLALYAIEPALAMSWAAQVRERSYGEPLGALSVELRRLETRLSLAVERVERYRDELSLANLRLVLREALRLHPAGLPRSDLFQEGYMGVQKAALRFDPERGLRFSTYATYWVKQCMRQGLVHRSHVIRVPERAQEMLRAHRSGRRTTLDDEEAHRILGLLQQTVLFSAGSRDGSTEGLDFPARVDPVAGRRSDERRAALPETLRDSLGVLSERERHILRHRFGLEGCERRTLEEIGAGIGLSRERVRQIEKGALEALRGLRPLESAWEDIEAAAD